MEKKSREKLTKKQEEEFGSVTKEKPKIGIFLIIIIIVFGCIAGSFLIWSGAHFGATDRLETIFIYSGLIGFIMLLIKLFQIGVKK